MFENFGRSFDELLDKLGAKAGLSEKEREKIISVGNNAAMGNARIEEKLEAILEVVKNKDEVQPQIINTGNDEYKGLDQLEEKLAAILQALREQRTAIVQAMTDRRVENVSSVPEPRNEKGVIEKIADEDFKELGNVQLDEHGHIRYAELDFGEIIKQKVLAELKRIGIKISIVDKEIGYELRCTAPIAYDIDYARSLGYEAMQFLLRGDSGALITIQDNKAVPMRFEDIKDPETGKTAVRRVNINSVQYKIARSCMMRLEKPDLDDPAVANGFRMEPEEFKARYSYLFGEA